MERFVFGKSLLNFAFSLFFIIMIIGCNQKERNNIEGDTRALKSKPAKFLIFKDTESPLLIKRTKNLNQIGKEDLIITKKRDTFSLRLDKEELFIIQNKNFPPDTVLVGSNDTIIIRVSLDSLLFKKKNKKSTRDWKVGNNFSSFQLKEKNSIDSLQRQFYQLDYNNPLKLNNDYNSIVIHPILPNFQNLKNEKLLKEYIDRYNSLFRDFSKNENLNEVTQDLFRNEMFLDYLTIYKLTKDTLLKRELTSSTFLNENTPYYLNGRNYIFNIVQHVYFKNKKDISRSKDYYDLPLIYDSIPNFLSEDLVKYARRINLEEMAQQNNPLLEIEKYLEKYQTKYGNDRFVKNYNKNYLFDIKKIYGSTKTLNLINERHTIFEFQKLLENLKGYVVYIDFWASWCSPCRRNMPYSHELQSFFKNEKVAFVYISIDKNKKDWIDASKVESLDHHPYNYLLLNQEKAELIKELNIDAIPRYLIYDTNGNLIHGNAPGPGDNNIHDLIEELL